MSSRYEDKRADMLVRLTRHFPVPNLASFRLLPLALLTAFLSIPLFAGAQTPTAEQIQIFQNLPADQQQAIIGTLGGGAGSSGANGGVRSDRQIQFPNTVLPRNSTGARSGANLLGQEGPAKLKGEDTLLLSLEIREYKGQDQPQVAPVQYGPLVPATQGSQPTMVATPAAPQRPAME